MGGRRALIFSSAALTLALLAVAAYSTYSQPELDSSKWLGLLSPMLAGAVPPLTAIALRKPHSRLAVAGLGALTAALFFVVPLYIGLRQQSASNEQLALAAVFISWLAAAAGIAGAAAAGLVLGVHAIVESRARAQRRTRIVQIIEREARAANGSATAIELGPIAFSALARDWGDDASALIVSRLDGRFLGLASERWPAAPGAPGLELPIIRDGSGEHVHIRTEME